MDERILSGVLQTAEADPEVTLRPRALLEFIGQPKLKETLGVFLQAARQRQEPLDHVLLCGPPGLGKTTLAHIIAREMGAQIRVTSGPSSRRRATSPRSSRTSRRATSFSWTRSTACRPRSRRSS